MKNRSLIIGLTGMLLVMQTACSSEQWRRTGYQTLEAAGRQQCLNEAYTNCPRPAEYDEYLQEREQVLQPANSE